MKGGKKEGGRRPGKGSQKPKSAGRVPVKGTGAGQSRSTAPKKGQPKKPFGGRSSSGDE